MPDENRIPEEDRANNNGNEDMSDGGSSQGLAPTGGGGQGGTFGGGTGDPSAAPVNPSGVTTPATPSVPPSSQGA